MKGAQLGVPGGKCKPPRDVRAEVVENSAIRITWTDASDNEGGFRVDRKIGGAAWTPIAYRPPRIQGHPENPQQWIDYLAPPGKPLSYRVVSVDEKDSDEGASTPTDSVEIHSK